jgi:CRP/FNR family transcriptional regulator, cyclic AMP receptor protein
MAQAPSMTSEQVAALLDVETFIRSSGVARSLVMRPGDRGLFIQGDPAASVFYVQEGAVKLSVLAKTGKEAVVAMFGPGDFVGEGALTGQTTRMASATATQPTRVMEIQAGDMLRLLHSHSEFSDVFIAYTLARNIRVEADLVDQLFNRSEKRLARALLLLARYGAPGATHRVLPKVSQEVLAEMVGTTRSRVNFFMNKFRKLGFIDYNGDITVHDSLLTVVLHD